MRVARAWHVMETSTKYNRYAARIPKGMGVKGRVVGSLSFDVQGQEGVQKLDIIDGCRKYMVP